MANSTVTAVPPGELFYDPLLARRRRFAFVWSFIRKKPLGTVGAVLILVLLAVALVGPNLADDPLEFHLENRLQGPSSDAWFGTDDKGRDVLSRVIHGTRLSLQVGLTAATLGVTFGMVFGLFTGYMGGKVDLFGQRAVDSFLTFPSLLLAMLFTVALGRSTLNVSLALAFIAWPSAARVIRAATLSHAASPYVEAARVIGASTPRILFAHLLPNLASIYIVIVTAAIAQAILAEASLSFLGVGVPQPQPSLGSMVLESQPWVARAPWLSLFPGLAIALAVFGFNLFGDGLRDALDPRLRER